MKALIHAVPLALGLGVAWAADPISPAPAAAPADPGAGSGIHFEMTQLIRDDARIKPAGAAPAPAAPAAPTGVVMMDPFVVKERRKQAAPLPHYETPLSRLLNTGTLLKADGRKSSLIIDFKEDTQRMGPPRPTIQFHLSW